METSNARVDTSQKLLCWRVGLSPTLISCWFKYFEMLAPLIEKNLKGNMVLHGHPKENYAVKKLA